MKNYVQPGDVIDYTAGGTAITSGDVVTVGGLIGVAVTDIPANGTGAVAVTGVYDLPKVAAAVVTVGEHVIWDASETAFNDAGTALAAGDISKCCVAVAAAGNGDTTVRVLINAGLGTVT